MAGKFVDTAPGCVEEAIAAVAAAYRGLTKLNGHQHDVKLVTRVLQGLDSLSSKQLPAILVIRPPGASSPIEPRDATLYKQDLELSIVGMLRGDGRNADTAGLASFGESLVSDMKRVAMKDPTFGKTAKDSVILDDSVDLDWDSTNVIVTIGLNVILHFDATNP